MFNVNKINNGQNENNTNKNNYKKLRPIVINKREIRRSNNYNLSLNNKTSFKKFLLDSTKRKKILNKDNTEEEFHKYTEKLENSMHGYQMSYSNEKKEDDEEDSIDKYISKKDKEIIKKVHDLNNSYDNRIMSPKSTNCHIKIEINEMNYPNPIKSLGVIRNNRHIYNELSKNILTRQSESFNKQIEEIEQYNMKYGKKMPKIHITDLLLKDSLNMPLMNTNKKREVNLPNLLRKEKNRLRLYSYFKYPVKNYPEGREQFSICIKNSDIIITGGISTSMKHLSIWSLNIPKLEWEKVNYNNPSENRYGHTALALNNKLYIYGGKTKYANSSVLNGLDIFSFNNNSFSNNNIIEGEHPENRRNHIALLVGMQMLIHGGINEDGKVLNDTYILSLNQLKWHKVIIERNYYNNTNTAPKLYGHACSLVIPLIYLINPKFSIYSFPENDSMKKKTTKEKGLYIFGGKTKEDGGLSNQLWILIMGRRPLEWIKPETKGKPPIPRYFHTMNYFERGNYLIVHGGRNDSLSDNSALNDTFLLNLENFEWIEATLFSDVDGFKVLNRCGHQSIIFYDKLIILGGMNNNTFLGSNLFIINLDFANNNNKNAKRNLKLESLDIKDRNETEIHLKKHFSKIENEKFKQKEEYNKLFLPTIK